MACCTLGPLQLVWVMLDWIKFYCFGLLFIKFLNSNVNKFNFIFE